MPELPEVYRTPPDLTRYTESTRRDVYDRLVVILFTAPDPATGEDPEDAWTPTTAAPVSQAVSYTYAPHFRGFRGGHRQAVHQTQKTPPERGLLT